MDEEDQMTFVRHVINSDHWAGNRKRKAGAASGPSKAKSAKVASKSESASKAAKGGKKKSAGYTANVVPGSYSILAPGLGGAVEDENILKGKTFVLTGIFLEVGGGDENSIGVENLKSMIESFGGKVTTRFSKNTSEYHLVRILLELMSYLFTHFQ